MKAIFELFILCCVLAYCALTARPISVTNDTNFTIKLIYSNCKDTPSQGQAENLTIPLQSRAKKDINIRVGCQEQSIMTAYSNEPKAVAVSRPATFVIPQSDSDFPLELIIQKNANDSLSFIEKGR